MEDPNSRNPSFAFFFHLLFFLIITIPLLPKAVAITEPELDAAIIALRSRDYNLFGNAIAASGVRLDLLLPANSSFTLLAPPDALLFSLDMATPSPEAYIANLRHHILPGRLTFSDLRSLPDDRYPVETLLPGREIVVSRRRSTDVDFLTVDGVDVVRPGIFYGRDLAVHGLGGIISLHGPIQSPPASRSKVPQSTEPGSELSPPRSADPPVPESPISSPATTPTISPDSSSPPSGSADPPVLGPPKPSPVVSPPADESPVDDVGFPWKDWACMNKENAGCVGTGWGWHGRTIGGWPRHQILADGAL